MVRLFERLSPEDIRLRFFTPWRELPSKQLARFTQIDYDREMAFALVSADRQDFLAIVRLAADPDNIRAEFAVLVRSDLKGHGLGRMLMDHLIAFARKRRIQELFGEVLRENTIMLSLCRDLGFSMETEVGAPGTVRATLAL
jgi:acetyltransferase